MPASMNDYLEQIKQAVRRFSNEFTTGQKAVTIVALLAVIVAAVIFVNVSSTPSWSPLFTNLQPTDAAGITAKLTANKVPYQLANGGSTILVPQNEVYQQRLDMAQQGLPSGGTVGLSLLDKQGITTSHFTQQVEYQQALQGELTRTIEAIHGVTGARVSLVLPSQSAFALGPQQTPSASVLVDMAQGGVLSSGEVAAIVHLVSASVANLSASNVTIVDSNGNLLAGPGANGQGAASNAALAVDNQIKASIEGMLGRILGTNNSTVAVNVSLNNATTTTTTKGIQTTPAGVPVTVPINSQSTHQTFTGTGTTAGGALGGITAPGMPVPQSGTYTQTQTSTTNTAGSIDQTVSQPPGMINHMSVSVVVNSLPRGVSLASLRTSIAAAAGVQPKRGDVLSVQTMRFSTQAQAQAQAAAASAAAAAQRAQLLNLIKALAILLVIAIVVLMLWRSSRKSARRRGLAMIPASLNGMDTLAITGPPTSELPVTAGDNQDLALLPQRPGGIGASLTDFIDSQPDEVAGLLRAWMHETGEGA